jgi:type VI secretion system protein ImpF
MMPRPEADVPLVPSILDRVIDLEPRVSTEPPAARARQLAQIKESVKRDLEWLLNSKRTPEPVPPGLPHLERSLLTFGMPDLSASSLTNVQDQDSLRGAIEAVIRRFEPRLNGVSVSQVDVTGRDRAIRFRIDAMLRVDPAPEPVTFDSELQLSSKAFLVRGDGG